ncbi:MAG TPA: hypothetical protein VHB50_24055 [Bryobacteraceae bacterium]|nr:hypothetical protein [Bryobacteraceae bacterium]
MIKQIALSALVVAVAAGVALSQDKMADKKTAPKSAGAGILQPGMEPTGGWTSQGDMGHKTAEPWSNTTMGASVNGKPLPGKAVTLTGEIVDLSCYLQVGKHGDKHSSCGKKCIANGEPIGLVTKAGQVYLLMAEEHDPRRDGQVGFRKAAGDNFAKVMTVSGTETTINGVKAVYVQGYVGK